MARGGARAISGPAPDPTALRRDRDHGDWVTLPAAGRSGAPPEWPLTRPLARERLLWAKEWTRPQAVMWEKLGLDVDVALYVRSLVGAEKAKAPVNLRTLVKQQREDLGLSLTGLARHRWKIEEVAAAGTAAAAPQRARLKVVPGGTR